MSIDQRYVALYDEFTHAPLPRRVFMERLIVLTGSAAAAQVVLAALEPNYAHAQQIAATDPRITAEKITIDGPNGRLVGYMARPKAVAKAPSVLVIHENRGLNPHIEDVTRRFAADGFLALGLDFLTPLGGTPSDPDAARDLFPKLTKTAVLDQARGAMKALKKDAQCTGFCGAVGFCWGGGAVNDIATDVDEIDAGVVFYGRNPDLAAVPKIKVPLLLNYAGLDTRINEGVPAYQAALAAANVRHTVHMYPNVNHAFHNDTSADRYDAASAKLAYDRTLAFFRSVAGETGRA